MNKIQSISDIITNSSSEVFVIETDKHSQVVDFIKSICDLFGVNMYEIMEFDSTTTNGIVGYDLKCKKGDLVIYSTEDNSIPYPIMHLIENLDWCSTPAMKKLNVKRVNRQHLG